MSQSLSKILLHLVFSANDRQNLIPQNVEKGLHAVLAGVCRANGSEAFRVGGTSNHVHVACTLRGRRDTARSPSASPNWTR